MIDGGASTRRFRPAAPGARVTQLELFYDLVFVFAFIQLSTVTEAEIGPATLLAIFLLLAALWLAWSRFAALGNNIRADQGIMPLVGFAIMGAIFVSVAILPQSGEDADRALPAPWTIPRDLVFPIRYSLIWILEVLALRYASSRFPWLRHAWWKSAPALSVSILLLVLAASVPRQLKGNARVAAFTVHWVLAIGVAYLAVIHPGASSRERSSVSFV